MSLSLQNTISTVNNVVTSIQKVDIATSKAFDIRQILEAQNSMGLANEQLVEMQQNANKNAGAQEEHNSKLNIGNSILGGMFSKIGEIAGEYMSLSKIINLSDTMAQNTAQLNLMNDGLQTTEELQDKVFAAAQRSRAPYDETLSLVSKLGQQAGDAFTSNDETIAFAENLNKSFVIANASQEQVSSASMQLTQALGNGVLRGEELNEVFNTAPNIIQSIADYMNIPIGKVKELASAGGISADIVKNSMLGATDSINSDFESIPMTWEQLFTSIENNALKAFAPVLDYINKIASSEQVAQMIEGFTKAFNVLSSIAIGILDIVVQVGGFITENWSIIEPILWGIAAGIMAIEAAILVWKAAIFIITVAQMGLNTALALSGIGAIAILIGVIIGFIVKWVQSVGGIKIAWLICMNAILTVWDKVCIGFMTGVYWVLNLFDKWMLASKTVCTAVDNFMGDMKANILTTLQNMVNGAIGIINKFIGILNNIPGVSINAIAEVTFGTNAQLENEAEKAARNAALNDYQAKVESNINERESTLQRDKIGAKVRTNERKREIEREQFLASYTPEPAAVGDYSNNSRLEEDVAETAANTATMADGLETSEEDLKYMRDIAERDAINRFTTAEIKFDMVNNNSISSDNDIDGVINYMVANVQGAMQTVAEGVHE